MAYPVRNVTEPAALAGHENGKLPESILGTVPGQAGGSAITLLRDSSLRAWVALCAAGLEAGHVIKVSAPTSSYRTYAEQLAIWTRRMSTTRWPGATRSRWWAGRLWWLKPGEAAVAPPGSSYHSKALAVDAGEERDGDAGNEPFDDDTLDWLIAHAHLFGWSWEIQSEPWHLRYFAGDAIPAAVLAYEHSLTTPPDHEPPEDDDMPLDQIVYYLNPDGEHTHAYRVQGLHGKYLGGPGNEGALELVVALGLPQANTRATAFGPTWQANVILVDGPCANV